MELLNTNNDSFKPTPRLKSSPVSILFIPFNNDDDTCNYCKNEYSKTLLFKQKYCKPCLLRYIKHIKDDNTYLDVHIRGYTQCVKHNKHETTGNTDFCTKNILEWCKHCSEISYFKQVVTKSSYYSLCLPVEDPSRVKKTYAKGVKPFANGNEIGSIDSIISTLIEKGGGCEICEDLIFLNSSYSCYQVSFEWKESTLTKSPIPILYLPWWDTFNYCVACNKHLNFISDCQKWCSYCFIIYIGCRYCLTTNVIFGITDQSQCRKCKRISSIAIDFSNDIDEFLISTININHHNISNYANDSNPLNVYKYIKDNYHSIIKWIPYSEITNLEKIAEGGFGIIYKANVTEYGTVAIKRFLGSKNISKYFKYFLNELKSLHNCYNHIFIIKCYGITRDPETKDYMLIMEYANGGNLHNFLKNNFMKITWNIKLDILWKISKGLECIHKLNSIHQDFHSGNILLSETWKIGDLGLSQPVNITLLNNVNNGIYGIIPYIAPEIFNGAKPTKESDIYSMGMIMWELTTGHKPFANVEHNINLIYEIIDGKRPEITNDTPECFATLMKKCWNSDPLKRPSITKICEIIQNWHDDLYYYYYYYENYYNYQNRNEIVQQFKQAEKKRLELINSFDFEFNKPHPGAIYTSRVLKFLISQSSSINLSSISSYNKIKKFIEQSTNEEYNFNIRTFSQSISSRLSRKRDIEELITQNNELVKNENQKRIHI
ncbi:kinase-like domain-containing protein [Glomus cerebriforme]|uniref:Kinase-like domain-containing protein n=1 Tax=Glomus cerebriforme TaxID=658196 RepID=A0A397TAI9_9GLOM|nr:kinase-like domain-containing protein [Glomus cerebriforme]